MSASSSQGGTSYLPATSAPPADVKNRQALEQKAGFDACKLLIRSVPSGANAWVDGAYVGKTPMLLIVPPGKYHIQLRDQRLDYAEGNVDLLPKETREFGPALTVRYPVHATVR
jgi:PEGA domain-containing protein